MIIKNLLNLRFSKYFLYGLFILLFSFSFNNLAFAETDIYGGVISQDTIWTKDESPYIIYSSLDGESNFTVDAGATLTIEAGVVVKFDYSQSINILGKLITNGTPNEKIYFTSIDDDTGGDTNLDGDSVLPMAGDWNGIEIEGGSMELKNSVISYMQTSLYASSSAVSLDNTDIMECYDGIYASESSIDIKNSNINNIYGDAMSLDFGSAANLNYSSINNIVGDGINILDNSTLNINNSNIENISGDAFFLYSNSTTSIKSTIIDAVGGDAFSIFYNSALSMENSSIKNISSNFSEVFADSRMNITDTEIKNINGEYIADVFNNSLININNSKIENVPNGGWAAFPVYNDSSINIASSTMNNIIADSVFQVFNRSHLTFSNSSLQNISGTAIEAFSNENDYATTTLNISSSTISDGDDIGLQVYGIKTEANITKSKIQNFAGDGIQTFSYPNILITDSEISNNNNGIVSYGSNLEIKNSIISGNTTYGISNNPAPNYPRIIAINNWWGDVSGPYNADINASGTANQVSWNVEYNPWLIKVPGAKPECCSNVLFIPGLEASRLYKKGLIFENQLWEPNRNADVEKLYLDSTGNSLDPNIYTNDIIKTTNLTGGIFDQDIYKKFSDTMDNLVTERKINGWEALPYDWRFDINKVVEDGVKMADGSILNFVDELIKNASSSATGKVTIVTHSNGGLIAKALINELLTRGKENLVDKLIMVAAPQLGTPETIVGMLHGDDQEIPAIDGFYYFLNKSVARTLGENMMGAYNLLPEDTYFSKVNQPIIKFDFSVDKVDYPTKQVANFRTKYGDAISSITALRDFLLGKDGRSEPANSDIATPNVLKTGLLSLAQTNHNTFDSWIVPTNIKVVQLASWGMQTIAGIEYFGKDDCALGFQYCVPVVILDRRPIYTEDGDKTVVTPSALAMDGAEKYYLNLKQINHDLNKGYEHKNILEATSTIQFINNFVLDENQDVSEYITREKPVSADKTLELALHSPVSINIYDNDGNHTGLIDNPNSNSDLQMVEENVPNSRYMDFGEGKYVLLDGDTQYSIKLQGLDFGTFTLETKETQNGTEISTSSFVDIPTSPNMTGEVVVSATSTVNPIIKIDANGDGKTDFIINGSQEFDPIIYLQILKKTIETFDANKNLKNKIIKKIDSIIKSLQKNKTKAAISKIKSFNKELSMKARDRQEKEYKKHKNDKDWKNKKHKLSKDEAEALLVILNQLLDNLMK